MPYQRAATAERRGPGALTMTAAAAARPDRRAGPAPSARERGRSRGWEVGRASQEAGVAVEEATAGRRATEASCEGREMRERGTGGVV